MSETIGCILCPITLGLSCCLPNMCIKDAEKILRDKIVFYNTYRLQEKGLKIKLIKRWSTSWFELSYLSNFELQIISERAKQEEEKRLIATTTLQTNSTPGFLPTMMP